MAVLTERDKIMSIKRGERRKGGGGGGGGGESSPHGSLTLRGNGCYAYNHAAIFAAIQKSRSVTCDYCTIIL